MTMLLAVADTCASCAHTGPSFDPALGLLLGLFAIFALFGALAATATRAAGAQSAGHTTVAGSAAADPSASAAPTELPSLQPGGSGEPHQLDVPSIYVAVDASTTIRPEGASDPHGLPEVSERLGVQASTGAFPGERVDASPGFLTQTEDGNSWWWDGAQWILVEPTATEPEPVIIPVPAVAGGDPEPPRVDGRARGARVVVASLVIVVVVATCLVAARNVSSLDATTASSPDASGSPSSEGSRAIGLAPGPIASGPDELPRDDVKLAPGTVVVRGNGGRTVKAIGTDGTTMTLDASVAGVTALTAGDVVILTGITTFKVASAATTRDGVVVSMLPAAITDVIADADLSWRDVAPQSGSLHTWDAAPTDVSHGKDEASDEAPEEAPEVAPSNAPGTSNTPVTSSTSGSSGTSGTSTTLNAAGIRGTRGAIAQEPDDGDGKLKDCVHIDDPSDDEECIDAEEEPEPGPKKNGPPSQPAPDDGSNEPKDEADQDPSDDGTAEDQGNKEDPGNKEEEGTKDQGTKDQGSKDQGSKDEGTKENPDTQDEGERGGDESPAEDDEAELTRDKKGKLGDYDYRITTAPKGGRDNYHLKITRASEEDINLIFDLDATLSRFKTSGDVRVNGSKLKKLWFNLSNLEADVTFKVEAGTGTTIGSIKRDVLKIPLSLDVPVPVAGIPFVLSIKAQALLTVKFTAQNSTVSGEAKLSFAGDTGLTFEDGQISADSSITSASTDPVKAVDGTSLGVTGMVAAGQFPKVSFGVGFGPFNAGIYYAVAYSAGVTIGSSAGIVACRSYELTFTDSVGVTATFLGIAAPKVPKPRQISKHTWKKLIPDVPACR